MTAGKRDRSIVCISDFRGVDLTNQPANVSLSRTANGLNMIRDVPGKVRKRMGYERLRSYGAAINGLYAFHDMLLVHAGTGLFADGEEPLLIGTGLADAKSAGCILDGKLCIADGENLWIVRREGEAVTLRRAQEDAYVPTVMISRDPDGGGEVFEGVNLLGDMRRDSFLGDGAAASFQLSAAGLNEKLVSARVRTDGKTWRELSEGTDFTVDRESGTVTFVGAPAAPPVVGEDNVEITYGVTEEGYLQRVNGCRFGITYGVASAQDRLFLSGNGAHPNKDFFSAQNDPTYFADVWFGTLGAGHVPVVGYSVINGMLAAHKRGDDVQRNIVLREGSVDETGEPQFLVKGVILGEGALGQDTFAYGEEPMFLTEAGICAATPYVYNEARYVQNRSFLLNGALLQEEGLENASACRHGDFYLLAVNGKVYVLDTLVRTTTESAARSDWQYEGFLWDNIPARIIRSIGGRLYFGTEEGALMRFFADKEEADSYADDGRPIAARWDIDFAGERFYRKKDLRYIAIRMAPAAQAACEMWVRKGDAWQKLLSTGEGQMGYLDMDNIDFDAFTFNTDRFPNTVGKKVRVRNFDGVKLSVRNEQAKQSFGFFEIALEYTERGYYKGGRGWQ